MLNGDVQTVMYRLLKNASECIMEAYELADNEGTEEESSVRDYYRVLSKIHDPICESLSKIKEAAFIFTMMRPDGENPLAGVEHEINEELMESFSRIMEDENEG